MLVGFGCGMDYQVQCFSLLVFFGVPVWRLVYSITRLGFSPTLYSVDPMLRELKRHEDVLSWQPVIPPKRFDIFPPV